MARVRLRISGRVQGVGFRFAAQKMAVSLGLRGWVRNLTDGGVELEMDGNDTALAAMQHWCHSGPALAAVAAVEFLTPSEEAAPLVFTIR